MAPIFKDGDAAHEIFRLWREELGTDPEDRLRVAIVRGINKAKPYSYRVVIGSSPEAALRRRGTHYAVFVSRLNTMEPSSNVLELLRWKRAHRRPRR